MIKVADVGLLTQTDDWVHIHRGACMITEALQVADGCLVRVGDNYPSSVFVPNSTIVDNKVVEKPTRIQVSKTQCITAAEVAAISKRPDELVFTLRCGKEISVTEDIDSVLATFMAFSP